MSHDIRIEMGSIEDSASVEAKIYKGDDEIPTLERVINIISLIDVGETEESLKQKLTNRCHVLYDRHVRISTYCERARHWTYEGDFHGQPFSTGLVSIDTKQLIYRYSWKGKITETILSLYLTQYLDLVGENGLTEEGQDLVVAMVLKDIQRLESENPTERINKLALAAKFLSSLPKVPDRRKIAEQAAQAVQPFLRLYGNMRSHLP